MWGPHGNFHVSHFGPGGRSICIEVPGHKSWVSPTQFEVIAGRGASHNWKRSIRHSGRAMQHWIANKTLVQCPKLCSCKLCKAAGLVPDAKGNKTPVRSIMNLIKENDTDSGISIESYSKALKVEVADMPASATPAAAADLPAPSTVSGAQRAENRMDVTETATVPSASTATNSASPVASGSSATQPMPEFITVIQEALFSLKEENKGLSQMSILLYILHKYQPKEDIAIINTKLRSALKFLVRMDVVKKETKDGMESAETSDLEEEEVVINCDINLSEIKQETLDENGSSSLTKTEKIGKKKQVKAKKEAKDNNKENKGKNKKPNTNKDLKNVNKNSKVIKKKKKQNSNDETWGPKKEIKSKPKVLSPALAAVCGGKKMSRHEVVKKFWQYIKKNELQDPKEKSTIICDQKLKAVTKKKRIPQTEMLRCLGQHLTDVQEK